MGSCEPCQVGNQAALSSVGPCAAGQPVLSGNYNVVRDPQVEDRVYGLDLRVILILLYQIRNLLYQRSVRIASGAVSEIQTAQF